jgi:hypothetical protein
MGYVSHEGEWRYREAGKKSPDGGDEVVEGEGLFVIANEFALVTCRKVLTRNGERLEIVAPKRSYSVRLDAVELESLTWQPPQMFSALVATNPND